MEPLDHAKALTNIVRTAWTGVTAASLYVWLTLASLDDIDLFLPDRTFTLPVVGTGIDPRGFFVFAPFLLLAAYFYFHLMLARLFGCYCDLLDKYTLSKDVDAPHKLEELAPPWFLTVLTDPEGGEYHGNKRLDFHPVAFHLAWFFSYAFTPLAVFAMGYRYLRAHETFLTFVHAMLTVVIIVAAVLFWLKRCDFCAGNGGNPGKKKVERPDTALVATLYTLYGTVLLFMFSQIFVFHGPRFDHPFGFLSPNAQLYRAELSKRPAAWDEMRWLELRDLIEDWETCTHAKTEAANPSTTERELENIEVTREEILDELKKRVDKCDNEILGPVTEKTIKDLQREQDMRFQTVIGAQLGRIPGPGATGELLSGNPELLTSSADCQVLKDVVGKERDLRHAFLMEAYLVGANLDCADLSGADLRRAQMDRASFWGADLPGAQMKGARLSGAFFKGALLREVNLTDARLLGTDFEAAILSDADFQNATLHYSSFVSGSKLSEVSFAKAKMNGSNFTGAELNDVNFESASLVMAIFAIDKAQRVNLSAANLTGATLSGYLQFADFRNATLTGADLSGAQLLHTVIDTVELNGTILDYVNFNGAALREVDLTTLDRKRQSDDLQNRLDKAFGDGSVKLPADVTRPNHWCKEVLTPRQFYGMWQGWRKARPVPSLSAIRAHEWIFATDEEGKRSFPEIPLEAPLPSGCPAAAMGYGGR